MQLHALVVYLCSQARPSRAPLQLKQIARSHALDLCKHLKRYIAVHQILFRYQLFFTQVSVRNFDCFLVCRVLIDWLYGGKIGLMEDCIYSGIGSWHVAHLWITAIVFRFKRLIMSCLYHTV